MKESEKARKDQNVLLVDNDSITAEKKIVPDSELLTGYCEGDGNEDEKKGAGSTGTLLLAVNRVHLKNPVLQKKKYK